MKVRSLGRDPDEPEAIAADPGAGGDSAARLFGALRAAALPYREVVDRGLTHLTAEDEQLNGRFITLGGRRLLNFGSCSYLGLETDLRLKAGACDAISRFGVQFSSSRAYVSCPPYRELEGLLQELFEAPVVVAPSTTLAHLAALPILVRSGDAVLCDQLVHSSVQNALPTLKAAGTFCSFVRHNRMDRLEEQVRALGARHERVWYLADGIYSMHGDVAPMRELRAMLARHERLHLYVDDAHGMSWRGKRGRGYALGQGPIHPRMVVVVSLNKAFSAGGGAVILPDDDLALRVRTCGKPLIFSGPLQPPLLGAAIASARIHLSREIEERQRSLQERIELFNALAADHGLPLGSWDETPIRFVATGEDDRTYALASALMGEGHYANVALFPAVSRGRGGVRVTLTLHHTPDDIRRLVGTIARHLGAADRETLPRTAQGRRLRGVAVERATRSRGATGGRSLLPRATKRRARRWAAAT